MLEKLKTLLIQIISYLSLYEIASLLVIFFVFIMFFTLGLLLRGRKFIARFFFFLSILVIFSTPFVLRFLMQKVLYTSEVNITSAHAMQYTNGFFVAGEITNKGKIVINECYIAVNEVRDEKGSKAMKILNSLFPKSSSGISIEIDIEVGETKNFAVIVPNLKAKEPFLYRIYVDCYLSNKFAQKMQKNKKTSTDIITPKPPKDNVETTQPPAQNAEDTQEEAEQPAQEGIEEETDKQDLQNQEASVPEQKSPAETQPPIQSPTNSPTSPTADSPTPSSPSPPIQSPANPTEP